MTRTRPDITIPDLTGRRAVVTGGSDGIGLRIATRLATAGAEVVLPVRNAHKGDAAVRSILEAAPGATVSTRELDLSSLESVTALTRQLGREAVPITILIANAGVMTPPTQQRTKDGFELQFGTNHLGHFALIGGLMPLLRAGGARITHQTSIAANQHGINWDDLQWQHGYNSEKAYSQSKIAVGLFALELERRARRNEWGVTSNLAHPGVAPTSLLAARPEVGRDRDTTAVKVIRALSKRGLVFGTPETAALPALFAATNDAAHGGEFIGPRGIAHLGGGPAEQPVYSRLRSEQDAARLWDVSEQLTGIVFA